MNVLCEQKTIERVLQGDRQAFAGIVDCYKDKVLALAFRMLRQRETAEEVTQDIFIKVFQHLASFKSNATFSTWLYRIAYNTVISEIRKQKITYQELNDSFFVSLKDDSGSVDEEEKALSVLNKLVACLPPEESALITLFYHEEKSMEEISRITSISLANVKVKIHRTRNKLREQMKGIRYDE